VGMGLGLGGIRTFTLTSVLATTSYTHFFFAIHIIIIFNIVIVINIIIIINIIINMIIIIIDIIIIIIMINILLIIINIIITIIIMIINMIINMIIIIIIIINCFGEVKKLLRRPLLEDAFKKKKKHEMQVLKASCVKKRATPRRGPSLVLLL